MSEHGQKRVIMDLVVGLLPEPERREFRHLADQINEESFFRILSVYLSDDEISSAKLQYTIEQLSQLEEEVGVKIDAVVRIYGQQYSYGNYNEIAGM